MFQDPWPELCFGAAPFVSHKDAKPPRCCAGRKAAFLSRAAASRVVGKETGLSAEGFLLRGFVSWCEKQTGAAWPDNAGSWMLKQVQHDVILNGSFPTPFRSFTALR
ncbi:hypothetical protein [Sphingopyxis sp. NJF-3]